MEYDPLPPVTQSPPPPPASRRPRSRLASLLCRRRVVIWGLVPLAVVTIGLLTGVVVGAAIHMPRVEALADYRPSLVTQLYDRDGRALTSFARERRVLLEEGEIPELVVQAIVAAEDRRFFEHSGIDLLGVFRAAIENLRAGEITQGASTLSMQLAENLFHTRGASWDRKIAEALLAVEIEKRYSKQQILSLYLNQVYFGHGNYGVRAAARYFFGKEADRLSLPEAAMLAGIVQLPSHFSPYRRPDEVLERRNYVLRAMRQEGYIDEEQLERALSTPIAVVPHRATDDPAAYFGEEIRQWIEQRFGTEALLEDGLQVHTTLDRRMQRAALEELRAGLLRLDHRRGWRGPTRRLPEGELAAFAATATPEPEVGDWLEGVVLESGPDTARVRVGGRQYTLSREAIEWTGRQRVDSLLERGDVAWFRLAADDEGGGPQLLLEQEPEIEGAVLVIETATGAVRAMVGGWDFERSRFNRATQALRQVGSAFKPFVYGAALESGFTPADTVFDGPVVYRGATEDEPYQPRNYYRRFYGVVTLRHALERSINVASVKLLELVGIPRVIDFAQRCGIESELPPYPSLALGSADLVPLEMAAAYATFANNGLHIRPWLVDEVADATGTALMQHQPEISKAMEPSVAYVLTHMLEGVVDRGTAGSIASLPLDLAGKTGTTDEYTDAWFVGYTPRYTILTWVGYDVKRSLGRGMTGAVAALPIWRAIVERGLHEGWIEEGARFSMPTGIDRVAIDHESGLLPGPGTGRVIEEAFLAGTAPTRETDAEWDRVLSLPWYQQLAFYLPKEGETMPAAFEAFAAARPATASGP